MIGCVDVRQRHAFQVGESAEPCGVCGGGNVVKMESRAIRRGTAWINPRWKSSPRTHDLCRDCGAKHRTDGDRRI
jgi:hypothetical protein